MSDTLVRSAREVRAEVEQLIRDDLVGPLGGETEELSEAPVDQYLLGLLAPRLSHEPDASPASRDGDGDGDEDPDADGSAAADELPEDELAAGGVTADSGEEGTVDDRPPAAG